MLGYGQQAGGTHPTAMHSCFCIFLLVVSWAQCYATADPGVPSREAANRKWERRPSTWPKFAENCMKMKKIRRKAGGAFPKFYYEDPPV